MNINDLSYTLQADAPHKELRFVTSSGASLSAAEAVVILARTIAQLQRQIDELKRERA